MSITGITTTMPSYQQQYAMGGAQQAQQAQQVQQAQEAQQTQAQQAQQVQQTQQTPPPTEQVQTGVQDTAIVTMDAPVELMDTTNIAPEDTVAQQQLQADAAAMTGVGQNMDITA